MAHSNPIATHPHPPRQRLQTTLSTLPRQTTKPLPAPARGSPDRVLTFLLTFVLTFVLTFFLNEVDHSAGCFREADLNEAAVWQTRSRALGERPR
jgi:hypothetical protein